MSKVILSTSAVAFVMVAAAGFGRAQQDVRPDANSPPLATDQGPASGSPSASQHYRAKQVLGSTVSLDGGRSAGTVDDIVFGDNGGIEYLVVVNSDSKLVTVPWDAVRFDADRRTAVVHISPERFQEIPTYTTEQYPAYWTPGYRTQIYKYYGLTPRQERRIRREERRRE